MHIGLTLASLLLVSAGSILNAQTRVAEPEPLPEGLEQSEALRETLKRMQIQREEQEFTRQLERGKQLREKVSELATVMAEPPPIERAAERATEGLPASSRLSPGARPRTRLPEQADRLLRELEKLARQIRSESGGSNPEQPLSPPSTVAETIDQLVEASDQLNRALAKTSRRVVSVKVIEAASRVIDLTRHLRSHLA